MSSLGFASTLLAAMLQAGTDASSSPEVDCSWSRRYQEITQDLPAAAAEQQVTAPKRRKGSLDRPQSPRSHLITGSWTVEAVLGSNGKVLDVKVIREPTVDPPWPEYRKAIIRQIMKFEYEPARLDGKAMPACLTFTLEDRP